MPTYPLTLADANGPTTLTSALTRAVRLSSRTASTSLALAARSRVGSVSFGESDMAAGADLAAADLAVETLDAQVVVSESEPRMEIADGGHGDVVRAGGGDVQFRGSAERRLFDGAPDLDVRGHVALDVAGWPSSRRPGN